MVMGMDAGVGAGAGVGVGVGSSCGTVMASEGRVDNTRSFFFPRLRNIVRPPHLQPEQRETSCNRPRILEAVHGGRAALRGQSLGALNCVSVCLSSLVLAGARWCSLALDGSSLRAIWCSLTLAGSLTLADAR